MTIFLIGLVLVLTSALIFTNHKETTTLDYMYETDVETSDRRVLICRIYYKLTGSIKDQKYDKPMADSILRYEAYHITKCISLEDLSKNSKKVISELKNNINSRVISAANTFTTISKIEFVIQ